MALMEFGISAYLAFFCIIVSSLALSSLFFERPRYWLSLVCKGYKYLVNQIHINIFLANSLEDADVLLGQLERVNRPEMGTKPWWRFSWSFSRKGRGPGRGLDLEKLRHRRHNSDHGVVESVATSSPKGESIGSWSKASIGKMEGNKSKNKRKH
jgi:hypothetical protein